MSNHQEENLLEIPGVGVSIAKDLKDLNVLTVSDLNGKDPEKLYDDLISLRGEYQDRCILYVFRCAVYYAETSDPDPELLKWWNWKDQ